MEGQNTNKIEDYEEINLREVMDFLIRNKFFIGKVTAVFVIVVFLGCYLMPKVYKVDTALEIGTMLDSENPGVIEDPAQLKDKISRDIYGLEIRNGLKITEKQYPNIKADNSVNTNVLYLSTESSKTDLAKQILEKINNKIIEDHKKKSDAMNKDLLGKIEVQKKIIKEINNRIVVLDTKKKIFEDKIALLEEVPILDQDINLRFAILDIKERLEEIKKDTANNYIQISSFEKELNSFQAKIDQSHQTAVIKVPSVSENPVKPRIVLYTVLAALLGFGAGLVLAFFKEAFRK